MLQSVTGYVGLTLISFYILGYDMSTFVRRYSRYLNQKAVSYRTVAYDFTRVKRGYVPD